MEQAQRNCLCCESGILAAEVSTIEITYEGKPLVIHGVEGYVCSSCKEQFVFPDQAKRNHVLVANAKRSATGLFTGIEIKSLRDDLGLSQSDAAHLFGGGANAFSKYERGDVIQSEPMDKLLKLAALHPHLLVNDLRAIASGQWTERYAKRRASHNETHDWRIISVNQEARCIRSQAAVNLDNIDEVQRESGWTTLPTSLEHGAAA